VYNSVHKLTDGLERGRRGVKAVIPKWSHETAWKRVAKKICRADASPVIKVPWEEEEPKEKVANSSPDRKKL